MALAIGLGLGFFAGDAFGFCRTTTCDPELEICTADSGGCLTTGIPLFWPDLCVTFGVHEAASPKRGISFAKAEEASRRAFQTWISADCGGTNPYIGVVSRGEIICDKIEYNHDTSGGDDGIPRVAGPNANLIVFRDDDWPYPDVARTIALTTITFAVSSGEILDADIEVNSRDIELTTGDVNVRNDLQSVMTHEIGHFFGLAHSRVPGASMNPDYDRGNLDFRSLSEDDRAGICEIYPAPPASPEPEVPAGAGGTSVVEPEPDPNAIDCRGEEPRYGFGRYCGENVLADGCSVASLGQPERVEAAGALVKPPKKLRRAASPQALARANAEAAQERKAARDHFAPLLALGAAPFLVFAAGFYRRRRSSATPRHR